MGRTKRGVVAGLAVAVALAGAGWKWRAHVAGGGQHLVGWGSNR